MYKFRLFFVLAAFSQSSVFIASSQANNSVQKHDFHGFLIPHEPNKAVVAQKIANNHRLVQTRCYKAQFINQAIAQFHTDEAAQSISNFLDASTTFHHKMLACDKDRYEELVLNNVSHAHNNNRNVMRGQATLHEQAGIIVSSRVLAAQQLLDQYKDEINFLSKK